MSDYSKHYKDSRWQQKRLEIMERDNWTCRSCGAKGEGVTLNVHHAYYKKGKMPWEYENKMLITWCEDCHEIRHEMNNDILLALSLANTGVYDAVYDFVNSSLLKSYSMMRSIQDMALSYDTELEGAYILGRDYTNSQEVGHE